MLVISKGVNVSTLQWIMVVMRLFFPPSCKLLICGECHSCGQMLSTYYPVISGEHRRTIGWQCSIEKKLEEYNFNGLGE